MKQKSFSSENLKRIKIKTEHRNPILGERVKFNMHVVIEAGKRTGGGNNKNQHAWRY